MTSIKIGMMAICAAALGGPLLQAQSECPAVNFQTPNRGASLGEGSNFRYILARQPDGSFTEVDYDVDASTVKTSHQVTKLGSVPNVQKKMVDCLGLGSRPRHPASSNLKVDPMGVSTSMPMITDLTGDGIGAMLALWPAEFGDQLLVEKGAADYSVASSTGYAVGAQSVSALVGDFNGDGKKDVAVLYFGPPAGNTGGGVSLLLGNGDGTLKPAVNLTTTGQFPNVGTVYDFNGDGLQDLALATYQGNVIILLGNKNGTFTTGATYLLGANLSLNSLLVADMNADGKADLLVFEGGVGIAVLNGNGDGTFKTGTPIPFAKAFANVNVGDFNKDGIMDLAISVFGEGLDVLLGTGGGKYAAPVTYNSGPDLAFYVEDFDGDGNLDLVFAAGHPDSVTPVGGGGGAVTVMFGNGDGTFVAPLVSVLDGNKLDQTHAPIGMVTADFNGDGKPDVATANASGNSVSVLIGQGAAGFKAQKSYSLGTAQPNAIAAGDFTGSGKPDLAVTDGKSSMYVLHNNGDGTFQTPIPYPVSGTGARAVAVGDFNNDKKLDAVVVNGGSNNISVLPGFGDSSFNNPVTYPVGSNPVNVVVGDFNGDGKLDLAVANAGTVSSAGTNAGSISVLLGNGDGTFKPAVTYSAYDTAFYPSYLALGDVDGDKKLDLVVVGQTAAGTYPVTVLLGNGDGTFKPAFLAAFTEFGAVGLALADLNGDGAPDLVLAHCCGSTNMTFMVNSGKGNFGAVNETEISLGSFYSVAVSDFNGDGKPDVAAASFSAGGLHMVSTFLSVAGKPQGTLVLTSAAGTPLQTPPIAPFSIATAKGQDLATGTLVNANATPPSNMLGTTVTVTDSQGAAHPAPLFYVSATQVNFLIPQDTATGNATVSITSGDGFVSTNTVAIAAVAPSIFTINSNALAAAYVQRVRADGSQSIELPYAVDGSGNVTFPPIDLGPSTDQVYLNIYGTGISGSPQNAVTVTVGNAGAQVFYSGVSTYPGEDQVVILLPRSLVGAGTVNMVLTASGKTANTTTLVMR